MRIADRLLTIVVTATLTSAFWLVAGASIIERAASVSRIDGEATPAAEADAPRSARKPASLPAAVNRAGLLIPVAGIAPAELADTYTDSRGGGGRLHEAIDIMAVRGTPVVAAASGKIEKLFRSDDGGNTIYIRSLDGRTIHYYAHLDQYAPDIAEGELVRAGQRLGTVGSTGNASPAGPHLHFAIMQTTPKAKWWEAARAINPYPLLTED